MHICMINRALFHSGQTPSWWMLLSSRGPIVHIPKTLQRMLWSEALKKVSFPYGNELFYFSLKMLPLPNFYTYFSGSPMKRRLHFSPNMDTKKSPTKHASNFKHRICSPAKHVGFQLKKNSSFKPRPDKGEIFNRSFEISPLKGNYGSKIVNIH